MFFDILMSSSFSDTHVSLERNCIDIDKKYNISMKKQSLDERFNGSSLDFIKSLLEEQLKAQITQQPDSEFLNQFERVIIGDATRFDVPKDMKEQLPGFSGKVSSQAGIGIQFEFDIKDGKILDLHLGPAVMSDSKYVAQKKENISKGDMYIRDLGYYSTKLLSYINKQEAWYCSRLNQKVNVYQKIENQYKQLSFSKLYANMKKKGICQLELEVYVGQKEKMQTRLIVEIMPDDIYAKRVRKIEYYNKHNGHQTSREQKDRMKFNLFITNAGPKKLAPEQVYLLYKIRWQIELRFKIWKSTFALDKLPKMKYNRYLCMIYAKLLLVFIYYEIIINIESALYRVTCRKLSLDKCFKTMKMYTNINQLILQKQLKNIKEIIEKLAGIFKNRHWLESKKNRIGFNEINELFI